MRHDRGTPNVTPTPSPRSWAPPAAARVSSDAAEGLRSLRRDERFVRRASTAGRPLYAVDATRGSVPRRGLPRCACPLLARYYNKLYATGTSAGAATRFILAVRAAEPLTSWTSHCRYPSRRRGRRPRPQRRRRAMVRAERTTSAPAPFNGPSTASRFAALLRAT